MWNVLASFVEMLKLIEDVSISSGIAYWNSLTKGSLCSQYESWMEWINFEMDRR